MDLSSDLSRPTSPESCVFSSPLMGARHFKGVEAPFRPLAGLDNLDPSSANTSGLFSEEQYDRPAYLDLGDDIAAHSAISEESEPSPSGISSQSIAGGPDPTAPDDVFGIQMPFSPLRKSASHESLLSVAGMDIHTPSNRHSPMGRWHPGIRIPQRIVSPSVELVSTPPVVSAPIVTADRVKGPDQSSRSLLASVAAGNGGASECASVMSADSTSTSTGSSSTATPVPRKSATLGRRVGGWVLGRWGMAPDSAAAEHDVAPEPSNGSEASTPTEHSTPKPPDLAAPLRFRFPGVNQKGPVLGLRPPPRAPARVHPQNIDEELLRESLAEDSR